MSQAIAKTQVTSSRLNSNHWDTHHFEQAFVWLAVAAAAVIALSLRASVQRGGELAILA
ncbi:MAG: hypothetical protein ACRDC6_02635 [Shewanella sp.]